MLYFFCRFERLAVCCFSFVTAPATTEIYTLSLHDALPILRLVALANGVVSPANGMSSSTVKLNVPVAVSLSLSVIFRSNEDRKSTRLNSSHLGISYAVFCLKKKKNKETHKSQ